MHGKGLCGAQECTDVQREDSWGTKAAGSAEEKNSGALGIKRGASGLGPGDGLRGPGEA